MFTYRITDNHLIVICATLERYAIYIEEIDLRYNQITDVGAKALGDLISKSPRLPTGIIPPSDFWIGGDLLKESEAARNNSPEK